MADGVKLANELPQAGSLTETDEALVIQGNALKRMTAGLIKQSADNAAASETAAAASASAAATSETNAGDSETAAAASATAAAQAAAEISGALDGGTANGLLYNNAGAVAVGSGVTYDPARDRLASGGVDFVNAAADEHEQRWSIEAIMAGLKSTLRIAALTSALVASPVYAVENTLGEASKHSWFIGASEALALTSIGLGVGVSVPSAALDMVGGIKAGETADRAWTLSTRDALSSFPVPSFRPAMPNSVLAFDIMPNGAPSENPGNGYAWLDVCAVDCLSGTPTVWAGRLGAVSYGVKLGLYQNGGAAKILEFINGPAEILVNDTSYNFRMRSVSGLGWSSSGRPRDASSDAGWFREDIGHIAQRADSIPQEYSIAKTYSGSTNYERGYFRWISDVFTLGTEKGSGGGSARALALATDGAARFTVASNAGTGFGVDQYGLYMPATLDLYWASRIQVTANASGVLALYNWGKTGWDRLQFGGTSANFPALKRANDSLSVRLADDSDYAVLAAKALSLDGNSMLLSDAANALAIRNGANPQALSIYGKWTDNSDYERLSLGYNGTGFVIAAEAAGTGTNRDIYLDVGGHGYAPFRFRALASNQSQLEFFRPNTGGIGGGIVATNGQLSIFGGAAGAAAADPTITMHTELIIIDPMYAASAGETHFVYFGNNLSPADLTRVLKADYNQNRSRAGTKIRIEGGDAYDSGATDRDGGDVEIQGGAPANGGAPGLIFLKGLPTSDPGEADALWNNSGVVNISAG